MGEAKRKRQRLGQEPSSSGDEFRGVIDLHVLPPVPAINGARIRELTGDETSPIPDSTRIVLNTFKAVVGGRGFHVGFCIGDRTGFSAIGVAVIDRLMMACPGASIHVVPVVHEDIAWDIVLRHLRNFTGRILLFAFPNSRVYDAGVAEIHFASVVAVFDHEGNQFRRLTGAQRRRIHEQAAAIQDQPPPKMYAAPGELQEDVPWIFRVATPTGKVVRTAVWNGRRDYVHELPEDIVRWVGGDRIAIVQVDHPVGINLRSSLMLTHQFSEFFDGVIHWARDTATFESILRSFIRLDLESISPPDIPDDWKPEVVIFPTGGV